MQPGLLIHQADGATSSIEGLPLIRNTMVCVVASGSKSSLERAGELADSVRSFLLSLTLKARLGAAPCAHGAAGVSDCQWCSNPANAALLVLVGGDEDEPFAPVPSLAWWLTETPCKRILPLLPMGANFTLRIVDPNLRKYNAAWWRDSIGETTPAALSAAGVTPDAHRIFISYRRFETQPLADDLFVRLTELGFEVFLDRFSVPAALNFQRRLHHELAEKSMVLLLESDRFGESYWCSEEIAYCKRSGLGLFALTMPFGLDHDEAIQRLKDVDDESRFQIKPEYFSKPPETVFEAGDKYLQWGALSDAAAGQILAEIRSRHDRALLRRRENLREQLMTGLKNTGALNCDLRADGLISAVGKQNKHYAIWITTRAPELPDFHVTETGCRFPQGTIGVVIGHRDLLEPDARLQLTWLSGVCKLWFVDEGRMLLAARLMSEGKL
jgi:hypothetical protein